MRKTHPIDPKPIGFRFQIEPFVGKGGAVEGSRKN